MLWLLLRKAIIVKNASWPLRCLLVTFTNKKFINRGHSIKLLYNWAELKYTPDIDYSYWNWKQICELQLQWMSNRYYIYTISFFHSHFYPLLIASCCDTDLTEEGLFNRYVVISVWYHLIWQVSKVSCVCTTTFFFFHKIYTYTFFIYVNSLEPDIESSLVFFTNEKT